MTASHFALTDVWLLDHRLPLERIPPAIVITGLFGVAGYLSRGVSKSGSVIGGIACLSSFTCQPDRQHLSLYSAYSF